MAFYNEVKPGDVFQPSANLHNDTVRLINRMNGISEATSKGKGNGATVLKVYNPTDVDFAPGTPVNFDNDQAIVEEHVPIKSYSDEQAPWGVLKDGLQANSFGSCIVSGPVTVALSGEGKYAVPSESGFELADEAPEGNSALVLYKNTEQAVICLGAGGGGGASDFPEVATIIGSYYNFNYLIEIGEKKKKAFCIIPLKHYNLAFEENETILVDPFYCQLIPYYTCYSNGYSIGHSGFLLKYPVKYI